MGDLSHRGIHITCDFRYAPSGEDPAELGAWFLSVSRDPIVKAGLRIVNTNLTVYDGVVSPPGFSAIHTLDSSTFVVHAYTSEGLVACELFTCFCDAEGPARAREAMGAIEKAVVGRLRVDPSLVERGERLRFPTFTGNAPSS